MSQKGAKRARQAQRPVAPGPAKSRWWSSIWVWVAVGAAVVAAVVGGTLVARGGSGGPALVQQTASGVLHLSGTSPITGQEVSLAAYAGRPVVLNVWGSWCPGCRQEARDLARFAATHPEVQVIGVDYQDTKGGARDFYREFGWQHPSIFDPRGKITFALGVQGFPTTFFLDRRHRIVSRIIGATDLAGFDQGLRAAERAT